MSAGRRPLGAVLAVVLVVVVVVAVAVVAVVAVSVAASKQGGRGNDVLVGTPQSDGLHGLRRQ